MRATITSIAHYAPPDVVTNEQFARLGVNDDWVRDRTGIRERRHGRGQPTSELILPAARACLERAGRAPADVDCVVVATLTPDRITPPTASILQGKLGLPRAWGFDLNAACSGFVVALVAAARLVETGTARRLLLCAGDAMTTITDSEDPKTAPLFGDAGAAVLLEATDEPEVGLIDQVIHTDPAGEEVLLVPAGGSARPATAETVARREHRLLMDGRVVFKAAVPGMVNVIGELLRRNDLTVDDVNWLLPHQANLRIMDAVADRVGMPKERVMVNIDRFGNTSAATIPSCLSEWHAAGKLRRGDRILMCSFGAGYISGGVYLRWGLDPD